MTGMLICNRGDWQVWASNGVKVASSRLGLAYAIRLAQIAGVAVTRW